MHPNIKVMDNFSQKIKTYKFLYILIFKIYPFKIQFLYIRMNYS